MVFDACVFHCLARPQAGCGFRCLCFSAFLDSGLDVLDSGHGVLDSGLGLPDFGLDFSYSGHGLLDSGHGVLEKCGRAMRCLCFVDVLYDVCVFQKACSFWTWSVYVINL